MNMKCLKCDYVTKKLSSDSLCSICKKFAPCDLSLFNEYISDKIDWKVLEPLRKFSSSSKKILSMSCKASNGSILSRPPLGYMLQNGVLVPSEDASKVHSLFKTFLNRKYSLTSLAKNFSLSTNGLKKVLSNRTYLGEIKFAGNIYKGNHSQLISPEIFYAVQRKLKAYERKKKE